MNRFRLVEALSEEEKIDMWHNGTRGMNIKALGDEKLKRYYQICLNKNYYDLADKLEDEADSRNLVLNVQQGSVRVSDSSATQADSQSTANDTDSLFEEVKEFLNTKRLEDLKEQNDKIIIYKNHLPVIEFTKSHQFILPQIVQHPVSQKYNYGKYSVSSLDVFKGLFDKWYKLSWEPCTYSKGFGVTGYIHPRRHEDAYDYLYEDNMAQYIWSHHVDNYDGLVYNMRWDLCNDQSGEIIVDCVSRLPRTVLTGLTNFVNGQNSDGLGEGFEQQDFITTRRDGTPTIVSGDYWRLV